MSILGQAIATGNISKPASNPTGQSEAPGKRNIVKNVPNQPTQFGSDGFSKNQSKPKASVK